VSCSFHLVQFFFSVYWYESGDLLEVFEALVLWIWCIDFFDDGWSRLVLVLGSHRSFCFPLSLKIYMKVIIPWRNIDYMKLSFFFFHVNCSQGATVHIFFHRVTIIFSCNEPDTVFYLHIFDCNCNKFILYRKFWVWFCLTLYMYTLINYFISMEWCKIWLWMTTFSSTVVLIRSLCTLWIFCTLIMQKLKGINKKVYGLMVRDLFAVFY